MPIQTLRNLEHNALVEREAYPVVPPKVEYSLTPLGLSLQPSLESICQWPEQHLEEAHQDAGQAAFGCSVA